MVGSFRMGDVGAVERGMELLAHRGPDGRGLAAAGDAVHGHVRLSLVDLTAASAQPFRRGGGTLSWVGELWNRRQLRRRLEQEGEAFATEGDTEVLAAALSKWGAAALPRLDGMFALAWGGADGGHLLARDRLGKVPLHVARRGESFGWASELKGLGPTLAAASRDLPPGCRLDLAVGRLERFAGLAEAVDAAAPADADGVLACLRHGVRRRMDLDARLCCLLSGGLDSSLLLLLAQEVDPGVAAFTAVLDPASTDLAGARRLCSLLGVRLTEVAVPRPTAASMQAAVAAAETSSKVQCEIALACLPLAARIGRDGFKACLSGEGADELFGGYGNSIIAAAAADDDGWRRLRLDLVARMARGNFPRCNKAFMASGVECRLPFMERALVESVLAGGKQDCPPGKGLLKAAARLAGLPGWLVDRNKETFQGGAGVSAAVARVVADPARFFRQEFTRLWGRPRKAC